MERFLHHYQSFSLDYIRFGSGPEILLTFHGFGRKGEDFLLFEKILGNKFTVYSFNFFHHGNSVYPDDRIEKNTLEPKELYAIFNSFLEAQQIKRFSLMGYSMGGKISLALTEHFASRIDHLFLMAPDGIKINFWYKFTSKNSIGNIIYRRILYHPKPFFRFLKFLNRIRLVSDKMQRFVLYNLETEEKRKQVYTVWMTLRYIEPNPKKCAQLIIQNNIQTHLFFGKYDQVIKVKTGLWFSQLIKDEKSLHIVECGHNLFVDLTLPVLQEVVKKIE